MARGSSVRFRRPYRRPRWRDIWPLAFIEAIAERDDDEQMARRRLTLYVEMAEMDQPPEPSDLDQAWAAILQMRK